jgi:hypothetical protein
MKTEVGLGLFAALPLDGGAGDVEFACFASELLFAASSSPLTLFE